MIFTCKDCFERHSGCHDKCEKYIREKAEYEKIRGKAKNKQEIENYTTEYFVKKRNRYLRKYGKTNI